MTDKPSKPGWTIATHTDVEPMRVTFTVGVQTFLLAYEAEDEMMCKWMADMLRHALQSIETNGARIVL